MSSLSTTALGSLLAGVGLWGATGKWWAAFLLVGAVLLCVGFFRWIEE